jgi:hypothetical protein
MHKFKNIWSFLLTYAYINIISTQSETNNNNFSLHFSLYSLLNS